MNTSESTSPKISILTPTIRPKGLAILQECLKKQTFQDFEWLVEVGLGKHDLNAAYNRLIRRSTGELIVSLQDYIKIEPDALEKLWEEYQKDKRSMFTCPVGKVDNEEYQGEPKFDWRSSPDSQMDWRMWEIDLGACPREALLAVGGFDERLDEWWSSDNVSVGRRAHLLGYKFKCLREIRGVAYDHDAFIEHPFRSRYRPGMVNLIMEEYDTNPKLHFLNS